MRWDKLDVYRVAVELRVQVSRAIGTRGSRDLRDQFKRASSSVILNIAEGAGRWEPLDKRRFFVIARGSAFETAAAISLLHADQALTDADYASASDLATRVMMMLTKLCLRTERSADSPS